MGRHEIGREAIVALIAVLISHLVVCLTPVPCSSRVRYKAMGVAGNLLLVMRALGHKRADDDDLPASESEPRDLL
jgi:hypothetical protein